MARSSLELFFFRSELINDSVYDCAFINKDHKVVYIFKNKYLFKILTHDELHDFLLSLY